MGKLLKIFLAIVAIIIGIPLAILGVGWVLVQVAWIIGFMIVGAVGIVLVEFFVNKSGRK